MNEEPPPHFHEWANEINYWFQQRSATPNAQWELGPIRSRAEQKPKTFEKFFQYFMSTVERARLPGDEDTKLENWVELVDDHMRESFCAVQGGCVWVHDQCGYWQHQLCVWCEEPKYPNLAKTKCRTLREDMGKQTESEFLTAWMRPMDTAPRDRDIYALLDGNWISVRWGKASHVPFYGWIDIRANRDPEDTNLCEPDGWVDPLVSSKEDLSSVPESVTLDAASLVSKWGFGDGDLLEWLEDFGKFDRHDVLIEVVKTKLLPVLPHDIKIQIISCIHNPIRAAKIDGEFVTQYWYDSSMEYKFGKPDEVVIPGSEILAIARRMNS